MNYYLNFNQIQFFSNSEESWILEKRKEIKTKFEDIDTQIRKSDWRKRDGWKANGYVKRTVITIFGPVTFYRTKFFRWTKKRTKKTKYLADSFLQIEKYQRVTHDLKIKIIQEAADSKRQKDILSAIKYCELTTTTISKVIRNFVKEDSSKILKDMIPNNKIDLINEKYLYLEFDDSFSSFRQNGVCKNWQIRLLTAHTGRQLVAKNRFELINKRAFVKYRKVGSKLIPIETYIDDVITWLNNNYANLDSVKIIVCGDGAEWIKNVAQFLHAEYVLDKFHIVKNIRVVFPGKSNKNKNQYLNQKIVNKCISLVESGKSDMLVKLLSNLFKNKYLDNNDKLKKLIRYIIKNKEGIESYKKSWFIGCRTESQVSHIIKSSFGYGSKIYNIKTFMNFMFIKLGKINDYDYIKFKSQCFDFENESTRSFIRNGCRNFKIDDSKKPSDYCGIAGRKINIGFSGFIKNRKI